MNTKMKILMGAGAVLLVVNTGAAVSGFTHGHVAGGLCNVFVSIYLGAAMVRAWIAFKN
jgi:hypothetical protein